MRLLPLEVFWSNMGDVVERLVKGGSRERLLRRRSKFDGGSYDV